MKVDNELIASIIVIASSDKEYLEGCLASLLDQDMPAGSYEVIYADNGSTDGSPEYVESAFPEVRVLRLGKNYGFAEGNNRAAEIAKGRYISFQNVDTVAQRSWLPRLIAAIESDPQVKAAHPSGVPLNFGGYNEREILPPAGVKCELTRFGYVDFFESDLRGEPEQTIFIAGGSLVIDREIEDELQYYFDPSYFMYNEDTDLGLRINNLGYKILYVPSSVAYHQRDPSRRSKINSKGVRMAYLAIRNRFITFYKNMNFFEYLIALPLIFLGSIIKLRTTPLNLWKKMIAAVGLVPFTLIAFMMALIRLPRYAKKRKYILSHRSTGYFWLFQELWRRKLPPRSTLADG